MIPTSADNALRELMADTSADPEERAKAFQQSYPSLGVRVGQSGELSFSNVEGRDIYGPYMKAQAKTPEGRDALETLLAPNSGADPEAKAAAAEAIGPAGTIATPLEDGTVAIAVAPQTNPFAAPVSQDVVFSQQYKLMAQLTDPADLANARANLTQATTAWVEERFNTALATAQRGQGLEALRAEVERNIRMDKEAFQKYNNGVDLGETAQTLQVRQRLEAAEQKAQQEATRVFNADPEIAAAKARMQAVDMLFNARMQEDLSPDRQAKAKEEKLLGGLVQREEIIAIQISLGKDPSQPLDADVEKQLRLDLASGRNGPMAMAREIALNPDKVELLSKSTAGGLVGTYANNALNYKVGDPELAKRLKAKMAEKVAEASKPVLNDKGKPAVMQPKEAERQAMQREAVFSAIQAVTGERAQIFHAKVDAWQLPQDPELQAKVKTVLDNLKAAGEEANITNVMKRLPIRREDGKLSPAELSKISDWYFSQAQQVPGKEFFGPLAEAASPEEARSYIESIAVTNVSRDMGLVGAAWNQLGVPLGQAISETAGQAASALVLPAVALNRALFGTGLPVDSQSSMGLGAAVASQQQLIDYYKGRVGVDPAWLEGQEIQLRRMKEANQND